MKDLQFPMDLAVQDSLFVTQSGQLPNDDDDDHDEDEVLVLREWGTDRIYHLQPIAMLRSNADTGNVNALGLSARQTASFDITCEHLANIGHGACETSPGGPICGMMEFHAQRYCWCRGSRLASAARR